MSKLNNHLSDADAILRTIIEGTATHTGENFLRSLVGNLSKALGTEGAWITEYDSVSRMLKAVAFIMNGRWVENYEYEITGTVCEKVILENKFIHFPDNIIEFFPDNPMLKELNYI